jgi:hypothetical protein
MSNAAAASRSLTIRCITHATSQDEEAHKNAAVSQSAHNTAADNSTAQLWDGAERYRVWHGHSDAGCV